MTTTELIELLKRHERGGATGRSREVKFEVDDRIIGTDGIDVTATGDGLITELYLSLPDAKPHWIPCSERLPDSNGYVLVTDFGETDIGRRYDGKWVDCYGDKMKDIVAWMPLPQPYQAERREG